MLTNGGGLGILCADACEAAGLELPPPSEETRAALAALVPREASLANPIDMLGSATGATYEAADPASARRPGLDALIVIFTPPVVAGAEEVGDAVASALASNPRRRQAGARRLRLRRGDAPVPGRSAGVATFDFPESAARALGHAAARAEWLRRPAGVFPELDGSTGPPPSSSSRPCSSPPTTPG